MNKVIHKIMRLNGKISNTVITKKAMEKFKKLRVVLTVLTGVLLAPAVVFAVVQSLNGATGSTQTFVNDSNVGISTNTGANTHSLTWSGVLPVSRGGTGQSSFTAGSVLFSNGTSISQDNSNLFWDDANNILTLGGEVRINIGMEQVTSFREFQTFLGSDVLIRNGRSLFFSEQDSSPDQAQTHYYAFLGSQASNTFQFGQGSGTNGNEALIDFSSLSTNRTYFVPDTDGTFGLREANQTWTSLNKFEATASSSIYIGSPTKTGCIVMGDSDGSGVTYVTANDGVLSASTTKPSICQ